jgi:transaldolase
MTPICTIMIGRTDDWIKVSASKHDIAATPGYLDWAGIAVIKKAYNIFKQRLPGTAAGRRLPPPPALVRLIGGDLSAIPYEWRLLFNASDIEVKERMQNRSEEALDFLYEKFADFHGLR